MKYRDLEIGDLIKFKPTNKIGIVILIKIESYFKNGEGHIKWLNGETEVFPLDYLLNDTYFEKMNK